MKYFYVGLLLLLQSLCVAQTATPNTDATEVFTDVEKTDESLKAQQISLKNKFFKLIESLTDLQSAEDAAAAGKILNSYELQDAVNDFRKQWDVPVWVDINFTHNTLWTKVLAQPPVGLIRPENYKSLASENTTQIHKPYITLDAKIENKANANPKGKFTASLSTGSDNGSGVQFLKFGQVTSTDEALNKDIKGKYFTTVADVPIGERWQGAIQTYGENMPKAFEVKTKDAKLLEQYASFTLEQRIEEIKTLLKNGLVEEEEEKIVAIVQTVPIKDGMPFCEKVASEKLFSPLISELDGADFQSFIIALRKSMGTPPDNVWEQAILNKNYFAFHNSDALPYTFAENGKMEFKSRDNFSLNFKQYLEVPPLEWVAVSIQAPITVGALNFQEGDLNLMPAFQLWSLFNESENKKWKLTGSLLANIPMSFIGLGQINTARNLVGMARALMYAKGLSAVAVGVTGLSMEYGLEEKLNETEDGKIVLQYWTYFNLLYAGYELSPTALKAGQKLYTTLQKMLSNKQSYNASTQKSLEAMVENTKIIFKSKGKNLDEGVEVLQVAGSLVSRLDKALFTVLKGKVNQLDNVLKPQFLDDFANASDDVLKKLQNDNLFDVWKNDIRSADVAELTLYKSKGNLRNEYLQTIDGLKQEAQTLLSQNKPKLQVAEIMCDRRRQITTDFKGATPDDLLEWIFKFNDKRYTSLGYGDKWGQTWQGAKNYQQAKGLSGDAMYDAIIKGSSAGLGTKVQLGGALKGTLQPILSEQEFNRLINTLEKYRMNP